MSVQVGGASGPGCPVAFWSADLQSFAFTVADSHWILLDS